MPGSNREKAERKAKTCKVWHGARAPSVGNWRKIRDGVWLNLDLSSKTKTAKA